MERIKVLDITKVYERKKNKFIAVKGVSFCVEDHEILGLIGRNGAGKTSIVKMLAGIMMPSDGMVWIDGENPFKRSKTYRQKVSLVMGQKGQMDVNVSIWDNALYFASVYGIRKKEAIFRIQELAQEMKAESFLRQQVRTLSLGQKMKGEFIIAFLHNPSVIFLDEPTLGLDYSTQKQIRSFLRRYKIKNHAAIVLTSHNIEDIETLSDKIFVLDHGEKIFEGTIPKLREIVGDERSETENLNEIIEILYANKGEIN